ncbi:MAG: TIM-barrel domain-containing protein, partial [bacterium]
MRFKTAVILYAAISLFISASVYSFAAEPQSIKSKAFIVRAATSPLSISVAGADGKMILSGAPGGEVYALKGNKRIFLTSCKPQKGAAGRLEMTCMAGSEKYAVSIAMVNDYEFSMSVSSAGKPGHERLGHRFRLPRGESVYGLKEHVEGDGKGAFDAAGTITNQATLDQRGSTVQMYTVPTISIASPFHISSGGYGLFFDTTWPGTYDLADTEPDVADISFEGPALKMVFTFGPGMPDIIRRHTDRVGKTLLPPKWAASVFKWRDDHINLPMLYDNTRNLSKFNSQVYEDVMMLKKLGVPTGVYWLDRPWAKGPFGYDDFEFDTNRFPNPLEMVKWLEDKNSMKMLLWVAPWIYGDMRNVARDRGYLAPTSDKVLDLTNPEAVEWWQNEFGKMFDLGVAGFKLDRGEEVIPSDLEHVYHDGRTGREVHNDFPTLYAKAVQGACRKFRGDDCLVMPRSGFTGTQKYAVFWGGDTKATWRGLRSAVISCMRSGIMGFPVWGSDTGGYGVPETHELFSRWLQVSAFHPLMEVGGSGSHEPWNLDTDPRYDQTVIDNYRLYAKIHTELAPYNYSYMSFAHKTGLPIVRPLVYHWPEDPRVRDTWDEFMFGDWILAAPALQEGERKREVYLPEGKWFDFWNAKEEYDGSKNYLVYAPINHMPVFIRAGAIIPLDIIDAETGFAPQFAAGKFIIAMYPDKKKSVFAYFDGKTEADISMIEGKDSIEIDVPGFGRSVLLKVRASRIAGATLDGTNLEELKTESEYEAAGR